MTSLFRTEKVQESIVAFDREIQQYFQTSLSYRAKMRRGTVVIIDSNDDLYTFLNDVVNSCCLAIKVMRVADLKSARQTGNAFISVAVIFALVLSVSVLLTAQPLVALFGLNDPFVRLQAILIVRVFAVRLSLRLFNVIIFASLRAGGDSKFLAFLDSGILWLVGLPTAFFCVSVLHIQSIALVFLLVQVEQLVRVVVGLRRYFAGTWIRNLTLEIT